MRVAPPRPSARLAVKVPEITLVFWVVKVLTTGGGEAASDYLASVSLVLAAAVGLLGFVAALALQLRARRYVPWIYWSAVSGVAVFGTMAADAVHIVLGVPYVVTSTGYALAVAGAFLVWHRVEGTLDIHTVTEGRREIFYWVTVLATFALGTAVGDLSAFTLHLGYWPSAVLYAVLIAIPAVAWRLGVNPVVTFWTAYVLTRPLGASVADWLGKPSTKSGLGLGDGTVTVVAAVAIAVLVTVLTRRDARRATPEPQADVPQTYVPQAEAPQAAVPRLGRRANG
jgi:uncharacterized membrane-anchored protein